VLALLASAASAYGQSIAMVTHDPIAASFADRILFLADGKVVEDRGRSTASEISQFMLGMETAA
jgi:putative ABC transport system ATP-binding protein